jgi:hypothetical protein
VPDVNFSGAVPRRRVPAAISIRAPGAVLSPNRTLPLCEDCIPPVSYKNHWFDAAAPLFLMP